MNRFTDRTVVVTGGGGGIGTAVCTSFAEEGAKVAVLDRDESAAASTAQAITDAGGTAITGVLALRARLACDTCMCAILFLVLAICASIAGT